MRRLVSHGYGRFVALALVAGFVLPGVAEAQLVTLRNQADAVVNGQIVTSLVAGQQFKIRMSATAPADDDSFGFNVWLSTSSVATSSGFFDSATRVLYETLSPGTTAEMDFPRGSSFAMVPTGLSGAYYLVRCVTQDGGGSGDLDPGSCRPGPQLTIAADVQPTAAADAPAAQMWNVDVAVDLTLPAATGGNTPLAYSLSPALPAGLSFDPDTRAISGTPMLSSANTTYTMTATDYDGDTADLMFEGAVAGGISVADLPTSVDEGTSTGTYTVALDAVPTDNVTVTPNAAADNGQVSFDPAALTFTATDWNTAQTVSIVVGTDLNTDNETATLSHALSGADEYAGVTPPTRTFVIDDDEMVRAGVVVSETALSVAQDGGTGTYTVVLTTSPGSGASVTVTPASDNTDVKLSSAQLVFSDTTWNAAQTVTVTGSQDSVEDYANDTATISHAVSGNSADYNDIDTPAAPVMVTVTDPDTRPPGSISVADLPTSVTENTDTGIYTVVLDAVPSADVTVTPNAAADNGQVSFNPAALTFTATDWNTAQTVSIVVGTDVNAANETAILSHALSGAAEYAPVTPPTNTFEIVDDGMVRAGLLISGTTLTINEGSSGTYTVVLNTDPGGTDSVTVTPSSDNGDVTLSPVLIFTPGATGNWNTPQEVTAEAAYDEDTGDDTVTLTHTASGGAYDGFTATRELVVDDIGAIVVGFEQTSYAALDEGGRVEVCVVVTSPAPTAPLNTLFTLRVNSGGGTATADTDYTSIDNMTIGPFRNAEEERRKCFSVDVLAAADAGETFTLTLTPDPPGPAGVMIEPATATVTIVGDSAPAFASDTHADQSYTAGATVNVTLPEATGGNGDLTYTLTPAADIPDGLSFTAATRTLSGTPTTNSAVGVTLTYTATDADGNTAATDTDTLTFTVYVPPVVVGFEGTSFSHTEGEDDGIVEVCVTVFDPAQSESLHGAVSFVVSTSPGTADGADYNEISNQSVGPFDNVRRRDCLSVTITNDAMIEGEEEFSLILGPVPGTSIPAVTIRPNLAIITIAADDIAPTFGAATQADQLYAVNVRIIDLTLPEASGGNGDLTYALTPDVPGLSFDPATRVLSGTPSTAAAAMMLTYTAADADANQAATDTATQMFSVTVAADAIGISLENHVLRVNEGTVERYEVVLNAAPDEDVTVTTSSDDPDITLEPAILTFTSGDWNTAQDITVTVAADTDISNDTATISHTPSTATANGNYHGVTATNVVVNITDRTTDTAPTLAAQSDVFYVAGVAIPDLTLPEASGGNGDLRYALTPDVATAVPGLMFDPGTRVLSGTPSAATATPVMLTYTAADSDVNTAATDSAVLTFEVTVTVPGIIVAALPMSVNENSNTGAYTVALDRVPSENVTVTPGAAGDNGRVSFNPAALTFTTTDWNTAQTVSIVVGTDPNTDDETVTLSHALSGAAEYAGVTPPTRTFEIDDDEMERAGVVVSETALTVDQSGTEFTYTVVLTTDPGAMATVTPSSDNTEVTVSAALTFTPGASGDWNTAQTVTVTGSQDTVEDYMDDTATISHTVTGYGMVIDADPVMVTVTDPDIEPDLALSKTGLSLTEGGASETYTVALASDPGASESVTVTLSMPAALSIEPAAALVFTGDTAGNWNTPREVTVTALQDAVENFIGGSVDIAHTVSGATSGAPYDGLATVNLPVTITDNDTNSVPAFAARQGDVSYAVGATVDLTLPEASGGNGDLTYTLTPTADIPAALTFTAATRVLSGMPTTGAALTLTYTAADTDTNTAATDTAALTFVATITGPPTVAIAPPTLNVTEGGNASYVVSLSNVPAADVVVAPAISNAAGDGSHDLTLNPNTELTFTTTNWNTAQTVTVTAGQDANSLGAGDGTETATISHALTGAATPTGDAVVVTITDDDPDLPFMVPHTVPEQTFTVGVAVALTLPAFGGGNGDLTLRLTLNADQLSALGLTFNPNTRVLSGTPSMTLMRQGVGYSAIDVDDNFVNNAFFLTIMNPPPGSITVAALPMSVTEDTGTGTYTVALDRVPTGNVTVTPGAANDGGQVSFNPAALTFTTTDWNTAQTVSIVVGTDINTDDETVTLSHALSGATEYAGVTLPVNTFEIDDDEVSRTGVMISETALTVDQSGAGSTGNYTVVLNANPGAGASVTVTPSSDNGDVTVSAAVTFSDSTWNTAQTVTVTGSQDAPGTEDYADDTATISHAVSGYGTVIDAATVMVTVTDPDTDSVPTFATTQDDVSYMAGATVDLTLPEASGGNGDLTYTLTPTADIPAALTFTAATRVLSGMPTTGAALTLTYTAADTDTNTAATDTAALTFVATITGPPTVAIAPPTLNVTEGANASYVVSLGNEPAADVVVAPAISNAAGDDSHDLTLNPNTALTFTTTNWNTAQTVTVSAGQDANSLGAGDGTEIATISHALTGAATPTGDAVVVTITDDDPDIPLVAPSPVPEQTFTVGVAVALTLPAFTGGNGDLNLRLSLNADQLSALGLTFNPNTRVLSGTPSMTRARQAVAYRALDVDDDFINISFLLTIMEPPPGSITVAALPMSVDEGSNTGTYTVALDIVPSANVTVTPSAADDNGQVSFNPAALTFTTANWNTAQTVSIVVGTDLNADDETVTLSHALSGATEYAAVTPPVNTFEIDDDGMLRAGVIISKTALTVDEEGAGSTDTYTVVLNTNPGAGASVTVTPSSDNGDVTVSPTAALTFSDSTWNTAQTVTVTGSPDSVDDYADDTATISHAVSGYGTVSADPVIVTVTDPDNDSAPDFGAATQDDVSYAISETVDLTLPEASGGNGDLTYALTPITTIPNGLTFTAATRVLSGAPTTAAGAVALTYTVADSDANTNVADSAALTFEVTITAAVTVAGITITPVALTVDDGATGEYQVRLTTAPSGGPAIITPSGDNAAVTVNPATLTFSATDFGTAQTVTVTSAGDTDFNNDSATISHTVTGYDEFTDTVPTVAVTVIEPAPIIAQRPGESGVIDTRNPLQTPRGQSTPYEVVLSVRPTGTGTVTITLSAPDTIDLSLTEPQLTPPGTSGGLNTNEAPGLAVTQTHTTMLAFINANWDTAQTVWITPHADATQGDYEIMHTVNAPMMSNYYNVTIPNTPFRVTPPPADVDSAGLDDVNRMILPEVARALAGRQTEAIARRVRQAGQSGGGGAAGSFNFGGQSTLSGMAARHARTLADDDLDMKRILGDTDFVIPMGGAVSGLAGGTGGLGANAALWGVGDYRSLGGESSDGNTKWDGDLFGAHLGFDAHLSPNLLAGLMVSYSDADIDYEYPNAAGAAQKGDYELEMTSINPYIGWSALNGQLDIWATLGYGSGDLEITPDGDNVESLSSDVTMSNFGLGGSSLLRKNGNTGHELRVNAEAFHTRAEIDGADRNAAAPDELLELDVDATRLRLMLESRHPRTLSSGARLTPSAEIGMRQDTGDGRTGTGAEIGGGVQYKNASRNLTMEANARALLAHSGDYDDWGISAKAQLQPGADGQGLSLSLTPAYGKTAATTENIWNNGSLDTDKATNNDDNLQTTLKARIAYGLNLTSGLITPYTELTWEEESQTYRLGVQWDITKSLDLKLTGEQKANNNNILLKGEMSF